MSFPVTGIEDARPMKARQKFEGHTGWVLGVIQLPGGQQIMTYSMNSPLCVWDLQTGKQIANWRDGDSTVYCIALSPDGKKVVSGSSDGAVRLWNIDTGNVIAKWTGHTGTVHSVCWNKDAGRVVSRSDTDGTARVWDVESGKTVLEIKTSPSWWIGAVTYSPDATMIATINGDESKKEFISIWDANTEKLLTDLKGHTQKVTCLAWTGPMEESLSPVHSIPRLGRGTHPLGSRSQFSRGTQISSMALQFLRMVISSQAHQSIIQRDCGTSRMASPSVCP
jgi:WD40 repeat protein